MDFANGGSHGTLYIHYILLKNKGTQYILCSIEYKFYMCIELCVSYYDLRLPYRVPFWTLQMASVTKMRDAIDYGRVRTWYLTL